MMSTPYGPLPPVDHAALARLKALRPPAPAKERETGLVPTGYVLAVLIPILGFVIGLVVATRPGPESRHGSKIVALSVGVVGIILLVIGSTH